MYRAKIPGRARPRCLPALLAAALLAPPLALAAKTDVVVLLNGDRITGEVKQLAYGQLKYKTDDMGTIYIEWDKIRSLTTKQVLQVEMLDGRRVYGAAPEAAADESALSIVQARGPDKGEPLTLAMKEVARIGTVDQGAWYERLDGAASFGFNYTQGTDITQSNFSGNIGSRNYKRKWDVALNWNTSSESDGPSSERASLIGKAERFLPDRYYYEGTLEFSQNDELGLDLRSLVSGTFGRYLRQTSDREWRAGAGLAASREERSDGSTVESIELPLTTTFRMFRLDSPKTNVDISLTLLPSLTESGRWRGEAAVNARHEIIHDLFFEVSLYDSYDNRPPEGAESNDWNVVTSLGYSF
jgi:hypothetical protein